MAGKPVPEPPPKKSAGPVRAGRGAQLTGNGADVIAIDIAGPVSPASNAEPATPEQLAETMRQIQAFGRRGEAIKADIRDIAALRAAADHVQQTRGKIDTVVRERYLTRER